MTKVVVAACEWTQMIAAMPSNANAHHERRYYRLGTNGVAFRGAGTYPHLNALAIERGAIAGSTYSISMP